MIRYGCELQNPVRTSLGRDEGRTRIHHVVRLCVELCDEGAWSLQLLDFAPYAGRTRRTSIER